MFKFVKDSISDFIFCIGISVGLSINIFQAFYVPKSQSSNLILLIAFSSILFVGLFACSYNKKSVIISAIFLRQWLLHQLPSYVPGILFPSLILK
jgi:hypothetical protein